MNPAHDTMPPSGQRPSGPTRHLLDAARVLRLAGGALLVQASLHGQLVRIEWAAERIRLARMLGLVVIAHACVLCALLSAAALLLVLSWETGYRIPVLVGLPLLFATAGGIAWQRLRALSALGGQAFAATRAELAADLAMIRSSL